MCMNRSLLSVLREVAEKTIEINTGSLLLRFVIYYRNYLQLHTIGTLRKSWKTGCNARYQEI